MITNPTGRQMVIPGNQTQFKLSLIWIKIKYSWACHFHLVCWPCGRAWTATVMRPGGRGWWRSMNTAAGRTGSQFASNFSKYTGEQVGAEEFPRIHRFVIFVKYSMKSSGKGK